MKVTKQPTIIIDSREQTPLQFKNLPSEPGTLYTGDYGIKGMEHLFSVERKSLDDLCGSISSGRERFERELHRIRGYRFKRLLIIGSEADIRAGNYRSRMNPKSVLNTLHAFEVRYDCPIVFCACEAKAARLVERWAYWMWREVRKDAGCGR